MGVLGEFVLSVANLPCLAAHDFFQLQAMGVLVCPAAFTIFSAICWSKANRTSALVSLWVSLIAGMAVWFGTAKAMYGEVTVASTGKNEPVLAGNLVSLCLPVLIMVPWSLLRPESYDWAGTRSIRNPAAGKGPSSSGSETSVSQPSPSPELETKEKETVAAAAPTVHELQRQVTSTQEYDPATGSQYNGSEYLLVAAGLDPVKLNEAFRLARRVALFLTFALIIFMPCMMIIPRIWTAGEFTAWIAIVAAWMICSTSVIVILPIFESRVGIAQSAKGIWMDLCKLLGR